MTGGAFVKLSNCVRLILYQLFHSSINIQFSFYYVRSFLSRVLKNICFYIVHHTSHRNRRSDMEAGFRAWRFARNHLFYIIHFIGSLENEPGNTFSLHRSNSDVNKYKLFNKIRIPCPLKLNDSVSIYWFWKLAQCPKAFNIGKNGGLF